MLKLATIKKCREEDKDDRPESEQRWCLYTKDGSELLGRHPTKEEAMDQEAAIHANASVNRCIQYKGATYVLAAAPLVKSTSGFLAVEIGPTTSTEDIVEAIRMFLQDTKRDYAAIQLGRYLVENAPGSDFVGVRGLYYNQFDNSWQESPIPSAQYTTGKEDTAEEIVSDWMDDRWSAGMNATGLAAPKSIKYKGAKYILAASPAIMWSPQEATAMFFEQLVSEMDKLNSMVADATKKDPQSGNDYVVMWAQPINQQLQTIDTYLSQVHKSLKKSLPKQQAPSD